MSLQKHCASYATTMVTTLLYKGMVLTVIVVADGTTKVLVVGSSVCKTTGLVELLMVVAEIFSDAVEPSRNGTPISSVLTAAFINGYRSRRNRTFLGEFDLCMFDYLV
jgi:hypothetical protein